MLHLLETNKRKQLRENRVDWYYVALRRTPQLEKNGENVTSSVTRSPLQKSHMSYLEGVAFAAKKNFDINDKPHV